MRKLGIFAIVILLGVGIAAWLGGDSSTTETTTAMPAYEEAPADHVTSVADDAAMAALDIREWDVPWEGTRPRDPYVGPEGNVWFVGQTGHYVGVLDPQSGEFDRYDLDEGTGPHNLIVADDGIIWYAGNRAEHIGRLDPETGTIEKIPTPGIRDPHTLVFDSQGDIWFTAQGANVIGHLDTETRELRHVEVPTENARPYGIKVDSSDRPWIVMVGTYKLSTVDPETMELTEIDLPREDANPRRIGIDAEDKIWYVDFGEGYLGKYDPATEEFEEWRAPSAAQSRPYGMAMDHRGWPWFVETGVDPNIFVGFNPETESFVEATPVPSGGGTLRHMYFHEPTGMIWFGADTNTIGRANVGAVEAMASDG